MRPPLLVNGPWVVQLLDVFAAKDIAISNKNGREILLQK